MIGRWAGAAVLAGHGVVHLPGVALLWRWGEPGPLRYADLSPVPGTGAGIAVGVLWLVGAVLFVLTAVSLLTGRDWWYRVMGVAVVVSCAALLPSASMKLAAAGLVLDWILLVAVLMVGARTAQPRSAQSRVRELGAGLP
ncbi:MAG: hypothetical protein ACOH2F_09175 [Cellulomonas sp.]